MSMNRREFIQLMSIASLGGLLPKSSFAANKQASEMYDIPSFGQVRLLHITDCHAQLQPLYYREPHVNLGFGEQANKVPHIIGDKFLQQFGIAPNSAAAHAFTYLNFVDAAQQYGKVGGFAHLSTLVKRLRDSYGHDKTLLMDGGDSWQGSGTAFWTRGQDMVGACNLLGVDIMTGHWEFTYQDKGVIANLADFKGEFVAHNVTLKDEAALSDSKLPLFDTNSGQVFKPYTIRKLGGVRVAVIGQAFPYTPIAHPSRFVKDWTFGIRDAELQKLVNLLREKEKPDVVVLLSHNGMDVDLKLASKVIGIDAILGGHTHDPVPTPVEIRNPTGVTLVCNAGSNGKFIGVLDFELKDGKVTGYKYNLLPVFANLLDADKDMTNYINNVRKPYLKQLGEKLAVTDSVLYRRGNFNGTFDQVICDALRTQLNAQIALSPGFRWGTSLLPNQEITYEHVLEQTCITYPETYVRELSGAAIKGILEDVCDNLFNPDPYLQQGGDMVRVGGMNYSCDPRKPMNQRISNLTLEDGSPIEANKNYKVAGWAAMNAEPESGKPIWDVVAEHLRQQKQLKLHKLNLPKLLNVDDNMGIAEFNPFTPPKVIDETPAASTHETTSVQITKP
ncbi:MAG: thiosulfohydrolase SoxB [Thiotrichaceae bacterium]|nr:thiosulfohydrolase SoxB [Thiotrichaceae bacterium]